MSAQWECEDCGWPQPSIAGEPTDESECDNCGGEMIRVDERPRTETEPRVQDITLERLEERRAEILSGLRMSYEELDAKADRRSLIGYERTAWGEIREIDFLREARHG